MPLRILVFNEPEYNEEGNIISLTVDGIYVLDVETGELKKEGEEKEEKNDSDSKPAPD